MWGRARCGAGHAVSLPKGLSWLGTDLHRPTHAGFPASQKALKEQLVLLHCPCLGQHRPWGTHSVLWATACGGGRAVPWGSGCMLEGRAKWPWSGVGELG